MKKIFIVLLVAFITGLFSDANKMCSDFDKLSNGIQKETENNKEPAKSSDAPDVFDLSPMNFF